jgi:hypothetical protein
MMHQAQFTPLEQWKKQANDNTIFDQVAVTFESVQCMHPHPQLGHLALQPMKDFRINRLLHCR